MDQQANKSEITATAQKLLNEHVAEVKTHYTTAIKMDSDTYEKAREAHLKELEEQLRSAGEGNEEEMRERVKQKFLKQTER